MRIAVMGSFYERRLVHEGYVLKRRLMRLLRASKAQYRGHDSSLEILNHQLGVDIVGLIAVQVVVDHRMVTLITAPGIYFDPKRPERRAGLERLAEARTDEGRRTLVVSKHEIAGLTPFDLAVALHSTRPSERRQSSQVLVTTGRRSPTGPAGAPAGVGPLSLSAVSDQLPGSRAHAARDAS